MKYFGGMKNDSTLVIFALVAALGLVTVIAVDIILTAQEAEARGCRTSIAFNASKGRCFGHGPAVQSTDEATIEDQVEDEENADEEGEEGEENESEDDQDEEEHDE
jgi:phosphopantothenoylcysteine synthetase/decarboxylase